MAEAERGEGEQERGPSGEQTTWIGVGGGVEVAGGGGGIGLKGWPDRVNLNNSEQKTASLLTSPLLHFHWQLSNKYMLSSKTFKRSFSSDFSTKSRDFFFSPLFLFCSLNREQIKRLRKRKISQEALFRV